MSGESSGGCAGDPGGVAIVILKIFICHPAAWAGGGWCPESDPGGDGETRYDRSEKSAVAHATPRFPP